MKNAQFLTDMFGLEGSEYQRFIDILNCLAEVRINSVGIVDSTETFQ